MPALEVANDVSLFISAYVSPVSTLKRAKAKAHKSMQKQRTCATLAAGLMVGTR